MTEPLKFTYIRDILSNMKNINSQFIVLDVPAARKTKDGFDVRTIRVADKSGSINFAVWNEIGACLQPGDICRLINGYASIHKLCLTLNCGKLGELQKIGEFCMLFTEVPNMSAPNSELAKSSEQQQKPSTGDNGSGNFGSGGGAAGGNGSTGPAARVSRTDGLQANKSNGSGQSHQSTARLRNGPPINRKRKFLLDNPENLQQKNAAQHNSYTSNISLQNHTDERKHDEISSPNFNVPYKNVNNNNCSPNLSVNFVNAPITQAETVFSFSQNGGGWFKPMSRSQTEMV